MSTNDRIAANIDSLLKKFRSLRSSINGGYLRYNKLKRDFSNSFSKSRIFKYLSMVNTDMDYVKYSDFEDAIWKIIDGHENFLNNNNIFPVSYNKPKHKVNVSDTHISTFYNKELYIYESLSDMILCTTNGLYTSNRTLVCMWFYMYMLAHNIQCSFRKPVSENGWSPVMYIASVNDGIKYCFYVTTDFSDELREAKKSLSPDTTSSTDSEVSQDVETDVKIDDLKLVLYDLDITDSERSGDSTKTVPRNTSSQPGTTSTDKKVKIVFDKNGDVECVESSFNIQNQSYSPQNPFCGLTVPRQDIMYNDIDYDTKRFHMVNIKAFDGKDLRAHICYNDYGNVITVYKQNKNDFDCFHEISRCYSNKKLEYRLKSKSGYIVFYPPSIVPVMIYGKVLLFYIEVSCFKIYLFNDFQSCLVEYAGNKTEVISDFQFETIKDVIDASITSIDILYDELDIVAEFSLLVQDVDVYGDYIYGSFYDEIDDCGLSRVVCNIKVSAMNSV